MRPLLGGVIVMHNLKALAHTMHVHIRYAGNSNIVKTNCLLIPLNDAVFPATN
jgi:hypothetical protein